MMKRTLLIASVAAAAAACSSHSTKHDAVRVPSADGIAGADFSLVPMDIKDDCSALVLRGTGLHEDAAYVMPQAYLVLDEKFEPVINLDERDDGKTVLRFGLRFPQNGEQVVGRLGTKEIRHVSCDFGKLRARLREDNPRIQLASLPIKTIEVSLQGLKGKGVIGNDKTDILGYLRGDHVVEIEMNQAERTELLDRVRTNQGVMVRLDYHFAAQSVAGFVRARFESDKILNDVSAALDAKVPTTPPIPGIGPAVAEVDVRTAIVNAMDKYKAQIYQETSKDADFNEIAKKMVGDLSTLIQEEMKKAAPQAPAIDPAKAVATSGEKSALANLLPAVAVKAAINRMKTDKYIDVEYKKMGGLEEHTYSEETKLNCAAAELGIVRMGLKSGEETGKPVPVAMKPGVEISMIPEGKLDYGVRYEKGKNYYSLEMIKADQKLHKAFPDLATREFAAPNGKKRFNGLSEFDSVSGKMAYDGDNLDPFAYHVWAFEYQSPVWSAPRKRALPSKEIAELPLSVSFSKLGGEFSWQDVTRPNPTLWDAGYDAQRRRYYFRPLEDLGMMSFANVDPFKTQKVYWVTYLEEIWEKGLWRANRTQNTRTFKEDIEDVPINYSTVLMRFVLPNEKNFQVQLNVKSTAPGESGGAVSTPLIVP